MPRAPRVQIPGFHHVGARGNNKQVMFDDVLRPIFLFQLDVVARAYDWHVLGWALMSNHFHLLLEIGDQGLARGMHRLNLFFARASNGHFQRINHCVGDRYRNEPIADDGHLFQAISYVMWNPVRAGVVDHPAASTWTSYPPSAGLAMAPRTLSVDRLLRLFGRGPVEAHSRFRAFVDADAARDGSVA